MPYDERLVTRLVDELARFEFESDRLQVTCAELYRSARAAQSDELRLTEADLTRLEEQVARSQGTGPAPLSPSHSATGPAATSPSLLTGIFRRYLDQAIEPVESKHPLLGRLVIDALISRENTKLAVSQHDLRELDNPDDVDDALALLVDRHLVRRETRGDGPWFELIHECLVDELRRWLDRNGEFSGFCAARNLIADGTRTQLWLRDPGLLLSYESLAKVIDPHRDRLRLNRDQTEFVLRSQIYRGTLQRDCWAERFGKPETTMLLRQLLDDPDTNVRRTAAWAVSSLSDPDDSLMARCLSLALNANEEADIRNAAGFALALKGQARHLEPLRKETRRWRLPRHVKELLATLEEQGRLQGLASPWQQWRAQRRAVARVRKLYASQVEEHIWPAAVIGTLSGLLWALTSAVVIANFFEWVINPIPDVVWYQKAGVFLGAALLLGGVAGAFLGRSAFAWAVTVLQFCPRRPWAHVVQHSGVLFGLAFLSALLPVFLVLDRTAFTWSALWTLPAALATLLLFCIGLSWAAQVTRGCFGSQSSRVSIAGWTVVTNLVVGVALPLMSGTQILRRIANWNSTFAWDLALIWFAFTLVSSLVLFVMTLTLSIAETECHLGTIGPRAASPRRRCAFAVTAALLVPWFPWQFGIHSIPWLAAEHDISAGSTIAARATNWPDTHYFRLRTPQGSYFRVELPCTLKNTLGLNEVWLAPDGNEETLMLLPTGRGSASIGANDYFNLAGEHRLSFSPLTQLRVTSDGITALGPLNMHAQLGRDPTLSGGRTLEISAPPGSAEPGAWVKLYLLNPSPSIDSNDHGTRHRLRKPINT